MKAIRRVGRWTVLFGLACAAACARSDLGASCHLQDESGGEVQAQPGREYLYLGSSECASFACLATPGSNGGYCSQAYAGQGAACPSGMSCAQLNLTPAYLEVMQKRLTPERYQALFGQLSSSWYCVKTK